MLRRLLIHVALLSSGWSQGAASSWDTAGSLPAQAPLREPQTGPNGLEAVLLGIERGEAMDRQHATETALHALLGAVTVMQDHYFELWMGTWPTAIDWTAAVMGTQVSGALAAVTRARSYEPYPAPFGGVSGNTVAGYFAHISSFYFGENAFGLRLQAYDDMLWVVLGWLEAIQFIQTHSDQHYPSDNTTESAWFAKQFIPAFAHRARVFWDLAHKGWDTVLCGGGMIWNPRLTPYKNAITNELYIAASVSMYLHFPGDRNGFPFTQPDANSEHEDTHEQPPLPPVAAHEERYLHAAIRGYDWLMASGMTNVQGLFADGFHIKGWRRGESNGTRKCDVRNDMVYTYNQGVLLTGQRGLWRATGNTSYLDDGHRLIGAVIAATGWQDDGAHFPGWAGLGRSGVLEEACDARGRCSQDGQTFKGIFFHHLATFCAPLPEEGNASITYPAPPALRAKHARRCAAYAPWVARNARAAAGTRDGAGRFGEWWTVGLRGESAASVAEQQPQDSVKVEASAAAEEDEAKEDYRNDDIPASPRWQLDVDNQVHLPGAALASSLTDDPNRRGRGRTVETQSGGVAVLKALYMLVERRGEE